MIICEDWYNLHAFVKKIVRSENPTIVNQQRKFCIIEKKIILYFNNII